MKRVIGVIEYLQKLMERACNHDCRKCPICKTEPVCCPINGEIIEPLRKYEFSWFEFDETEVE